MPSSWARGFASLAYWNGMKTSGSAAAIACAIRMAPFEPSAPGENTISAPYRRRSCSRSGVVLSGITIRTG